MRIRPIGDNSNPAISSRRIDRPLRFGSASLLIVAVAFSACGSDEASTASTASTVTSAPSLPTSDAPVSSPTTESASATGTFEVNEHTLLLDCKGVGAPTVILEGGSGAPLNAMAELQGRLATQYTACSYERAHVTAARTLGDANEDLHALMAAANLQPPFVIVGQSIGGDLAQLYARTFADDVAGVVSMNSGPPCPPWVEALASLDNDNLLAGEQAYCADTGGSDRFDLDASYSEAQAAPAPPDIPFELILSTADMDWCPADANPPEPFASQDQCNSAHAIHVGLARDLVASWPQGKVTLIDAPHEIFASQLDAVVGTVENIISKTK